MKTEEAVLSKYNIPQIFLWVMLLFVLVHGALLLRNFILSRKDVAYLAMKEVKKREKAEKKRKALRAVYDTSVKIPFLRRYLRAIEKTYLGVCPYDEAMLVSIASETLALTFVVSVLAIMLIISFNLLVEKEITWYCIACCLLACYVSSVECSNFLLKKKEQSMAKNMTRYLSNVKNAFIATRDVPLSVYQAAEGCGHEINRQALLLHEILSGTEREKKVREYALAPTTNKYVKLFIQQAYEVSERGDILEQNNESLFIKNLEFLRIEIKQDMYIKAKRLFKLEGYTFACLLPVFFMSLFKLWGIKLAEDMTSFYEGAGEFIVLLTLIAAVAIYNAINRAKEVTVFRGGGKDNFFDRSGPHSGIRAVMNRIELGRGKRIDKTKKMLRDIGSRQTFGSFVLTMLLYAVIVTAIGTAFFGVIHYKNREILLSEVSDMDKIVSIATDTAKKNIEKTILDMTEEYLREDDLSTETLTLDFNRRLYMPNKNIVENAVKEVQERIMEYRNEYLKWYEFYLCFMAGLLASMIPYMGLRYRYNLVQLGKGDEVRQFQCIILMERLFPGITSVQMLEEMENFARVFKPSLRVCLNSYSTGPEAALRELKSVEKDCEEFTELIDGFLAIERVGVAAAFAEVSGNREMAKIDRDLDEEKKLSKQKDYTDLIAVIPGLLVMIVYFVGPFTINILSRLTVMYEMLKRYSQ